MVIRLIMLASLWLTSTTAFSCACGSDGLSNAEAFEYYDHIFLMKITEAKLASSESGVFRLSGRLAISPIDTYIKAEFEVEDTFKGQPENIEEIVGFTEGNSCGLPVIVGNKYLIYAKGKNVVLSICSHHKFFSNQLPLEYIEKVREEINWLRGKSSEVQN